MNSSPPLPSFRSFAHASPLTPRLYHQVVDLHLQGESAPLAPALKSSRKASAQGAVVSKRPDGLHFLMTPCSLRSLLPDQAYYTKFDECKSSKPQDQKSKSSRRLRKVSFDLEPRFASEESK